ncbi:MAG: hypothetical protein AAF577_13985 [Pseudomonadota bacterium]
MIRCVTLAAGLVLAMPALASAVTTFDDTLNTNVFFGTGNENEAFTVDRANGIEIGLRAKLRFDDNNQPQPIYGSQGNGTYNQPVGLPPTGFSFDPNAPTTPRWSFDWSINTTASGQSLDAFTYVIELDGDPTAGTDFSDTFDLINLPLADHSFGSETTTETSDQRTADPTEYANLIANSTVAQNSWNYEFFNGPGQLSQLAGFDPTVLGLYTIRISAFDSPGGNLLARSSIDVAVTPVPLPGALPLALAGFGMLAMVGRRCLTAA